MYAGLPPSVASDTLGSAHRPSIGVNASHASIDCEQHTTEALAIYIVAKVKKLPAEDWKGFTALFNGAKEASWGLFLIVIIMGGIYGGVFTPTEAAVVAAVYSIFVALFVYRDMGPLKETPWVMESDSAEARA